MSILTKLYSKMAARIFLSFSLFVGPGVSPAMNNDQNSNLIVDKGTYPSSNIDYVTQVDNALKFLLENLNSPEVKAGAIMASPTKSAPDYFFHWVRDAAVTMRTFVYYLQSPKATQQEKNEALSRLLVWVGFESQLQKQQSMTGLGEPKYNLDGTAYFGPWGRPQNDGPALRVITSVLLAKELFKQSKSGIVERILTCSDCLITKDIEFLIREWRAASYDLWEEVKGDHFYTRVAQYRAFLEAADLAEIQGKTELREQLLIEASLVKLSLQSFKDHARGLIFPTLNRVDGWGHKNSDLDVAVVLGVLHGSQPGDEFWVDNSMVLNSARQLEDVFKRIYPLATRVNVGGTPIGRYPEDVYDGVDTSGQGNPWFIGTVAYAELYCLGGNKELGTSFLQRAVYHAGRDGRMQEQFNRNSGYMQGARDLTWSYASYISAYYACTGLLPKLQ